MSKKVKKGFTLIELLVVIAIIGILAGLLLPSLSDVISKATATAMGSKARSVVQLIIAENIERDALSKGSIWPEDLKSDNKWNGTDSNGYLSYLVADLDAKLSMFAGGGVKTAKDNDSLKSDDDVNAWNIFWPGDSPNKETSSYFANGNPPFMVTRTFKGTSYTYTKDKVLTENEFSANKPFQGKFVVAVLRDNTVLVSKAKNLFDGEGTRSFFNSPTSTNTVSIPISIAQAKTAYQEN